MLEFSRWFWPSLAFLFAGLWLWTLLRKPRRAPVARPSAVRQRLVEAEDALKAAYALQEQSGGSWGGMELARSVSLSEALAEELAAAFVASGWAAKDAQGTMHLTEEGKARAQELIRAHRLWELHLVDREGRSLDTVHAEAHDREHETTAEELARLDAELGYPAWDPHGHPIPESGSQVPYSLGRALLDEGTPGSRLRVACLDDEPAPLLAQLVALGLRPGVDVEVLEQDAGVLQLRLHGNVVPLAAAAARHISVVPTPTLPVPLGELPVSARARVVEIAGKGKHQRRMLDMGFVPGAELTVVRQAPLGNPVEYHVKGTAVALRRKEANTILVEELRDA